MQLSDGLELTAGTVVDGKYRIERVLGEGGMGVVVRAVNLRLGSPVALKFVQPRVLDNPIVVERFTREASAAARLTSEHVARVLDVGSLPGGAPYMVLEYLDGETLSDALERIGPMPVGDACSYLMQACDALSEAHSLGIVHRDLKLANLFLAARPNGKTVLKVLDFGILKLVGDAASSSDQELTRTSQVLGTPSYMAPEQLQSSRSVDARADIWSCGVCLFRLLADKLPFQADNIASLAVEVMTRDAPDLLALRPDVGPGLAAVVRRCLQRDPEGRFKTAAELSAALAPYATASSTISSSSSSSSSSQDASGVPSITRPLRLPTPLAATQPVTQSVSVLPPAPPAPPGAVREPLTHAGFGQTKVISIPPPSTRRWTGIAIIALVLGAGGLATGLVIMRRAPPNIPSAAASASPISSTTAVPATASPSEAPSTAPPAAESASATSTTSTSTSTSRAAASARGATKKPGGRRPSTTAGSPASDPSRPATPDVMPDER
jgi:serine/threonine protein kinase